MSQFDQDAAKSSSEDVNVKLWIRFKAGDADAFGKLAQVHYRALYNYGIRFTSDSEFIRDCIQELYLELWERRTFLSETAFVKHYLIKSLRHKLIKETGRLKRFQEPLGDFFDADRESYPIEAEIIGIEQSNHISKKLNNIVSHLPKRQQEIIYLRFYQNLEHDEIAQIMGLGKQSVSNLLYRTLKDIKVIWVPVELILLVLPTTFYFHS